jgi:hypothetical protein
LASHALHAPSTTTIRRAIPFPDPAPIQADLSTGRNPTAVLTGQVEVSNPIHSTEARAIRLRGPGMDPLTDMAEWEQE